MSVEIAALVPEGWQHWGNRDEASLELGFVREHVAADLPEWIETMRMDAGRKLGFRRVVARRKAENRRS